MKLTFNRIDIYNYLSFSNETFDFSKHRGMNLVCGKNNDIKDCKNGTGKSSLLSALVFALFGQTPNKIKNENIPNRNLSMSEPCVVTAYFNIDDTEYKIESGLSPKYRASHCHVYRKNPDGSYADLTKSSVIDTHRFIETELLKCDMSVFLRSIYLSSDQTYNFFKLKTQQRKEFIEHLFDLSVFGAMYSAIHKDVLKLESEIIAVESSIFTLNTTLDNYHVKLEEYNSEVSAKKSELLKEINELIAEYTKLKPAISEIDKTLETYSTLESKLSDALVKIGLTRDDLAGKISTLSRHGEKIQAVNSEKISSIANHIKLLNTLCEKCKPEFDKHYSITETQQKIKDNSELIEKIKNQVDALDIDMSSVIGKIDVLKNELAKYSEMKHIAKSNKLDKQSTEKTLVAKIKMAKQKLDELNSGNNIYQGLISDVDSKLDGLNSTYRMMQEKLNYLKYSENIVSQDTLRKFIIKDLVVLLNNQIKIYLAKIGSKFICEFDENMEYKFITDSGYAEYDNFSSGERMRLAVATSFAFRDFMATRSNITSNILLLDEYIDSNLDTLAITGLIQILREFVALYNQNIYIVSHRKEIDNSIFNNIILIEKTNGISVIKYETTKETAVSK